jgi:flagellar biosynthesis protein FlhG
VIDAQAERLRARVAAMSVASAAGGAAAGGGGAPAAAAPPRLARTIAVASGKGGVGKSTVALGIAMAAAERGVRTALVDADLGLANLDLLCGVRAPRTAADWLAGRARLAECFVTLGPRLWLLPGASGLARMADLDAARRERLLEGLARVSAHVQLVVVDLGAGIGPGTLDIAASADRLLLVATPEPTSLADAYGFAKACARHAHRGALGWACASTMCRDAREGTESMQRLASAARAHVGVEVECVGAVPIDPSVPASVRARVPLLVHAGSSPAARAIRGIEARLVGCGAEDVHAVGGLLPGLAARLGVRWAQSAAAAVAGVAALGGVVAR